MHSEFDKLRDIDHLLSQELENSEINSEEIARLVDIREQTMKNILVLLEENPEWKQDPECQHVVARTTKIVMRMQAETSRLGTDLRKFKLGQRSLQQYKRFT